MSDSGFSGGLPPGPRVRDTALPPSRSDLKAEIIQIRGEMRDLKARQKVKGEIVSHNKDGSSQIRTPKGDITVRIRSRDLPPKGQKVDIDISPGSPPKQLLIRPVADQVLSDAELPPKHTEQKVNPEHSLYNQPLEPASKNTLNQDAIYASPKHKAQILEEQSTIRLIPLTPAQITQLPLPEILPTQLSVINQDALAPALSSELFKSGQNQKALINVNYLGILPLTKTLHSISAQGSIFSELTAALHQSQLSTNVAQSSLQTLLNIPNATGNMSQSVGQRTQSYQFPLNPPLINTSNPSFILPTGEQSGIMTRLSSHLNTYQSLDKTNMLSPFQSIMVTGKALQAPSTQDLMQVPQINTHKMNVLPSVALDIVVNHITPPSVSINPLQTHALHDSSTSNPMISGALVNTSKSTPPNIYNAPPSMWSNFSAPQMTAHVIGHTEKNLPIISLTSPNYLSTPPFVIQFNASNLELGSHINFTPLNTTVSPLTSIQTTGSTSAQELLSGFKWPALEQLTQTLQLTAPDIAQNLTNSLPSPSNPARIPSAILFFIAAMRSGDISSWLGDKLINHLKQSGKHDILKRISRDMSGLSRINAEPLSQEWRAMPLPLYWDGNIHKLQLYYKKNSEHKEDTEDEINHTRFLFDLSLSRMGPVQLDGLHKTGRLDLLIRTDNPLSLSMQQLMRKTFLNAITQAHLTGELSFQSDINKFIKIDVRNQGLGVSA